jgi:hypothetical protein
MLTGAIRPMGEDEVRWDASFASADSLRKTSALKAHFCNFQVVWTRNTEIRNHVHP